MQNLETRPATTFLIITLLAALAAAQSLPIEATIETYGAPPYSDRVPGTIFNLYEWVVINGTVTPRADFFGNITVRVVDTATNLTVASCFIEGEGLSTNVTYSLYNYLVGRGCSLGVNDAYDDDVIAHGLKLNFTSASLKGANRYRVEVVFTSVAGSAVFTTHFSVDDSIPLEVRAYGVTTIDYGSVYPHNLGYNFRLNVTVKHPDGRRYYNVSLTVFVDNVRRYWQYWTTAISPATTLRPSRNAIISYTYLSAGVRKFMVNVSNIRYVGSSTTVAVSGVNTGHLNFTLSVTNTLTIELVNVTAVWPNYTSTPPGLRSQPTGVSYFNVSGFNNSRWSVGDAFLMYLRVRLANGTEILPTTREFRDFGGPLTVGVANVTTARDRLFVVAVNASLPRGEWDQHYRSAHHGVVVNATVEVEVEPVTSRVNTGSLSVRFAIRNDTKRLEPRFYFNASGLDIANGSLANLGDVLALRLRAETWGGRVLNFTEGFEVKVYNVTLTGLKDYTELFDTRKRNDVIYLVVKPGRDLWKIADWRSDINKTYLRVNVTENGPAGRLNLTIWWPRVDGRYNVSITARLPAVEIFVNRTLVDYGQGVRLSITFRTHGGNATQANNMSLYIYKIDAAIRPFGWQNASLPFIEGTPYYSAGNYTFDFNVNGSRIWIPGEWIVNATVGDIYGNAGDVNSTKLFEIYPRVHHTLPASVRVTVASSFTLSSALTWGNGTSIGADARMNITITYPAADGRSYLTTNIGSVAGLFAFTGVAPNVPGDYKITVVFEYKTFGKRFGESYELNLTVYVAVNATFEDMRSDPASVAVAVGRSEPRGPVRGALVEDNLAAAALASTIGTTNVYFDDELIDPTTLAFRPAAGAYRYIVAVGGPLVNLASYKYNDTLSSIVRTYKSVVDGEVVEVGFEIVVEADIRRVYLNITDNNYYIVYANGTRQRVGAYGNTDFAVVATAYDAAVGKYVFITFGLDWRGTVAAGRWIAANVDRLDELAGGQLVLLRWSDIDNDGSIEAGEVEPVLSV